MASIGDIANEAKAILEDIRSNTLATRNDTATLVSETDTGFDDMRAGFANLAGGLHVLIQLGTQANELSQTNLEQNQTIICWLDNIAHVLCDMKRDLDASLVEQKAIRERLDHVDSILELVHSREAADVDARDRLQAQIDECCGPDPVKPKPCFEECEAPEVRPHKPVKAGWKPLAEPPRKTDGQDDVLK